MPQKKRLPPKVHEKHGRYFYVDKNQWIPLSLATDGTREMHRRLATLTGEAPNTLAGIFQEYADSAMLELRPSTQKQYSYFLFGILTHRLGHMLPSEIDEGTIAEYLEKRKEEDAAVSGNRERACLSSVFEYAMRKRYARRNPCRGVRRNRERASKVYIESQALSDGIDKAPPHYARILQFAYITGVRREDIMLMKISAIVPAGIEFTESKTGKHVTIGWTPTLRELSREILEARHELMMKPYANKYRKPRVPETHDFLFVNRFGKPLTAWGMSSLNRRLEAGFTFRQVRPKAQTDGGDRNVIGHTGQMRERYTRRRKLVPVR